MPSIDGDVNSIVHHKGAMYAHVTTPGSSGIYKYHQATEAWNCIIATGSNQEGVSVLPVADRTPDSTIQHLLSLPSGVLQMTTKTNTYEFFNGNIKHVTAGHRSPLRSYHHASGRTAEMFVDGRTFLDGIPAQTKDNIRFRKDTKIRTHEGKLLFVTSNDELVALDVDTSAHVIIAKNVDLFDVVPDKHILFTSGTDLCLRAMQKTHVIKLDVAPKHIIGCNENTTIICY